MDFYSLKDTLNNADYNALVYLLRKFKKLTCDLKLGASIIESDYGTFNFSDGFVNVGNNWILEDTVTVTSNDVLKNTFYSFHFTVINVDTSGIVNRRVVTVTGGTGDTGVLVLEIPSDIINSDEVILPDYKCSVVFDEHEYYTPLPDIHLSLSVDKRIIEAGEVATITGLLTDSTSTPIENVSLPLNVDGTTVTVITDSTGEFSYSYTGTGRGWVVVSCNESSVTFYDGDIVTATVTGSSVSLGQNLQSTGSVVVDWGDGTTQTINNPTSSLSHSYTDGLSEHTVRFIGNVTSLGEACFYYCTGLTSIVIPNSVTSLGEACFSRCTGLTSITIPNSVTSLGSSCFYECSGLTSVTIPDSVTSLGEWCFSRCTGLTSITIPNGVTSLGNYCFFYCPGLTSVVIPSSVTSLGESCFNSCSSLIDYQLYWTDNNIITYNINTMPVNNGTVFTIPYGTTSIYTDAGYPVARLVEREPTTPLDTTLSIASDKQTIYTDETIIITGTLLDEDNNSVKQASVKLYDGNTLLDTLTTDNAGAYTKTITGLTTGTHTLHTSFEGTSNYNASASSNIIITVSEPTYNLVLSSDTPIIQKTGTAVVNALLSIDGSAYSSQSLSYTVKHGSTVLDSGTVTTGSDGTASISYTGTGVGDVDIVVSYGTLLQEKFVVEDCLKYYPLTDNTHESAFTIPSGVVSSYSSDGWNMSATNYSMVRLTDKLTNDCSVEFTISDYNTPSNNYEPVIIYAYTNGETTPNQEILTNPTANSYIVFGTTINEALPKNKPIRIEYTTSTLKLYVDNVLKGSINNNIGFPTRFEWHMGSGGRYAVYKDLKVKAL